MGAASVRDFDIDQSTINIADRNLGKLTFENTPPVEFAEADVLALADVAADTVLRNPLFGTLK
jgi:predicted RNA methylase